MESSRAEGRGRAALALALILSAALLLVAAAATAKPHKHKQRPNLEVTSVSGPAEAIRGSSFEVASEVANSGKAKAKRSSLVSFSLSTDKRSDSGDAELRGGRTIGKLKPRKSSTGTVEVSSAVVTPTGSYYVIACADSVSQVRESDERDNCTASAERIELKTKEVTLP